jgi:signal transduction histidine kinase
LISLGSNVVVAYRNGEILSTNSSIEPDLLYRSAHSAPEFRVGANCLEIYQRSSKAGNPIASEIMDGLTAVLEGARPRFELEWASDSQEGRKWIMTSVTPLEMKAGGLVITHTEITDRKKVEEERLELSGRLIDMQEKERSRLARELHDDFNQRLAVLAIDLERAAQTIEDSPVAARERLHGLWRRASEIGADLHGLSHRLHSSTLESLGLVLGVSSLCSEFEELHGIQVDFTHKNIARSVSPDIALCLFRVAQETLRNVKRHSGASRAEVRLEATEQVISLSISDAGTGFDPRALRPRAGLGIRSMQERLRLLGGHFEICSQP